MRSVLDVTLDCNVECVGQQSACVQVERSISIDSACEGQFARNMLAVSHRWETAEAADPSGAQFKAIREHLLEHPEVEYVWYDSACLPSGTDLDEDEQTIQTRCRQSACLPFLCMGCLLLVDGSYCTRFWTQYEVRCLNLPPPTRAPSVNM